MLPAPERLKAITHPLISSLHMRKDYKRSGCEDVLIIEANFPDSEDEQGDFDSYLMDLLIDLEELKNQVETKVGHFDRVDIRTH